MTVERFLEERYALYVLAGLFVLTLIFKLLVAGCYRRLICAAKDMAHSKHKLMKVILLKFETNYKLHLGVNNVDVFVDKYILSYKCFGLHLFTWENIGNQFFVLTLIGSIIGGVATLYLKMGQWIFFVTVIGGFALCGILLFLDGLVNLNTKKELLRTHMKDYLENVYRPRLENQEFHPEEIKKYQNDYFDEKSRNMEKISTQKEPELKIEFSKEEERVIADVLEEYIV